MIVVDDSSSDLTGARAAEAGATVVRNAVNLGYDRTLAAGFEAAAKAGFSHVVTLDADGEHDPTLVATFCDVLLTRGVALVLGVRPRKQRLAEKIMGIFVRVRFGAHDILCGMKGYNLALWRANGGFDHHEGIGTELAINALRAGLDFVEINVTGTPRADAPRFDRRIRANMRILRALFRVLTGGRGHPFPIRSA